MGINRQDGPVPAVVAGAGPFEVVAVPLAVGGRSSLPRGARPGIFVAPTGAGAEEIGVRQHEYGHLAVESSGVVRRGVLQYLVRRGVSEFWAQAGLDCIVNGYMLGVGCAEISSLHPSELPPPPETPRFLLATVYLRCELLDCASEYRPILIAAAEFDNDDVAMLNDAASRFALNGRDRAAISSRALLEELLALQAVFGPHRSGPDDGIGQKPAVESVDSVLKQGLVAAATSDRARWGEMEYLVVPHNRPHAPARTVLRRKPGAMGPLRFPHRAVMGGDGQAFAQMSRAAAGAALIDCSGSMSLDENTLRQLMSKLPAAEIALYAGFPQNDKKGWLCVIARSGRLGELSRISSNFGGYNVVDGPALQWLASKRSPRFWISDGAVNGCGGLQSKALFLNVIDIVRQFRIQRLDTLSALLDRVSSSKIQHPR